MLLGANAMGHDNAHSRRRVAAKLKPVLEALLEASRYATDTDSCVWDFAVSIRCLLKRGASETDLRWLVRKGFVEHGREVTVDGDDGREFRPAGNMTFSHRTCFILTYTGIAVATSHCSPSNNGQIAFSNNNGQSDTQASKDQAVPHWDAESRKLRVDGILVKRFKWLAANQEAILCAFEEEGWPEKIDDPLPPHREQDSKRRLADTIKCLNRKQVTELIHFHGDGTGEGVTWERLNHVEHHQDRSE